MHPSIISLLLLLGWIRTKPREVAGLITIIAGSPHCPIRSHSSLGTALYQNCGCLVRRYCHLVRLLGSMEILTSLLRWPEPSARCRWAIWRTTSHRCSSLGWTTFKGSLACLGCGAGVVILLLLQTVADEVIESDVVVGTNMLHHFWIESPLETGYSLSIGINHVESITTQVVEGMQILCHGLGALIQRQELPISSRSA